MKLSAAEIKDMTGCATRAHGETALYASLETKSWHRGDRIYKTAGYDRTRDLVHFTATWSADNGGVGHSRLALSLKTALKCTGDSAQATVLH